MTNSADKLIITGASKAYQASLLALLGSLTLNWHNHPPVLVYDLGMEQATLELLYEQGIAVKPVPPFCPHWRKHFTWKIWAWNDAPAREVLWFDAGIAVLQPLDEIFESIAARGYFVAYAARTRLTDFVSDAMCRGCGVPRGQTLDKPVIAGGVVGFRKEGIVQTILQEALAVALVEVQIRATAPLHRHDQAILSLLFLKYIESIEFSDLPLYTTARAPRGKPPSKLWVHRRTMSAWDQRYFAAHLSKPGAPYLPHQPLNWRALLPLYRLRRWLAARDARFLHDGVRD